MKDKVFDKIRSHLHGWKQIGAIYLDISKAFDSVSHKRLLPLRECGFGGSACT